MTNVQAILEGDRLALSRLISEIENDSKKGQEALTDLFPYTGKAHLIGVTGAPGTGKSSLVNQIASHYRQSTDGSEPKKVAIVAIDPSSPFSGGAVLGDRIRMSSLRGDPGVFIRSMASRGNLGGLSRSTAGVVQAFDAAGYEIILIETVGAGQAEVDIARLAYTTLVVEAPGLGDDIQAIKAGIMEIADILVVNKADRPGVENTERALRNNLQLAHPVKKIFQHHGQKIEIPNIESENEIIWVPPILRTIATEGSGISELLEKIGEHKIYLKETGNMELRERARLATEFDNRLQAILFKKALESLDDGVYEIMINKLINRELSPSQAAAIVMNGGTL